MLKLRDYQQECINIINELDTGSYLIQMGTGLGKTVTFSQIPTKGKVLIVSHREELVFQPEKYYTDKTYSVEMGKYKADMSSDVISTCIATMVNRYKKYDPEYFDIIIWDECHHLASKTYKQVFKYFKPRLNLGFTATPNRADGIRLDDIFEKIIYQKDLLWGIRNKYLSDINCKRVYVKYDLNNVKSVKGDYKIKDLENELIESDNPKAIAKIYKRYAIGRTLIFGVNVKHCELISEQIENSVVVSAATKDRASIIEKFSKGEIKCLVNCMIFTEGTDIPNIETIIMARPTKNLSLYTQIVGRGLRLFEGKEKLNLIDCIGVSSDLNLCTASSLLGIDYNDSEVEKNLDELALECDLFDLPAIIQETENHPNIWKINYKVINLWAKRKGYQLHNVNWFRHSDGSFSLSLKNQRLKTSSIDHLGKLTFKNRVFEAQNFFDRVYIKLKNEFQSDRYIWDLSVVKNWGYKNASDKQIQVIRRKLPNYDTSKLNKLEACQILNKLFD